MVHAIIQDKRDAERMFVAISAAGVFRSEDGGRSWQPKNQGVRADFLPETYPEVGQCCHHLVMSPENSNVSTNKTIVEYAGPLMATITGKQCQIPDQLSTK